MTRSALPSIILVFCLSVLAPAIASAQIKADSMVFVMRLGRDTTHIIWTVREGERVWLRMVERAPKVALRITQATLNSDGSVARLEQLSFDPAAPPASPPTGRTLLEVRGDSTAVVHGDSSAFAMGVEPNSRPAAFAGRAHMMNNLFMVNSWPVLAAYAPATVGDSVIGWHYPMASLGMRRMVLRRISSDWVSLGSDVMGTVRVRQDAQGRAVEIDALGSSWNLHGKRVAWLDSDSVVEALLERERREGALGSVSPSGTAQANVHGASLRVDYGRPFKRRREIFGGIVPWNRVWRTGAGPATLFTTDRTLTFGEAIVPAGSYTLWTLPAPEGWMLIINRQTGQWGTLYDESHDFVRVPMRVRSLAEPVEQFTIRIEAVGSGGVLRLIWDTTEASAAFSIR
ncbi:MAG: DUF2911 domain-containing protein [Longimicrobiaceae bacterium]